MKTVSVKTQNEAMLKIWKFQVTKLKEREAYKFRVKALNGEGEGESLETDDTTVAKNPFGGFNTNCLYNVLMMLPHLKIE